MFWNNGEIDVEDLIVGANIFHQISIDRLKPSLKANSFYLQVFEKVELLTHKYLKSRV